jgi:hypothetical protein
VSNTYLSISHHMRDKRARLFFSLERRLDLAMTSTWIPDCRKRPRH